MARLTDRDALLVKVTKLVADGGNTAETVGKIIIAITDAPIADAVEVVHGRWDRSGYCSECNFWTCYCGDYHYCPNCGAKMDGERKDNDE